MAGMALGTLIDEVLRERQWPQQELVRRAEQAGYKLNRTEVSDWRASKGWVTLVPENVRTLATALGVPAYRVAVAVLQDMGISVPLDESTPERAIELDTSLPRPTKQALLAVLREARSSGS